MKTTPKGEQIPQTVENLLEIMAADAERMLSMDRQITILKQRNLKLEARILKMRRRHNGRSS